MRNKTTEVTESTEKEFIGVAEYVHEEVNFVQVNYARFLILLCQINHPFMRLMLVLFSKRFEVMPPPAVDLSVM